jgi:diguanylate cyclase (GGDEF)-like protein
MPAAEEEFDLAAVLDEHLRWFADWHRIAFPSSDKRNATDIEGTTLTAPPAFARWVATAGTQDMATQLVVERLTALHEHLHLAARLVLMKSAGGVPETADYEAVVSRFTDFMHQIRRVERAFAAARAGLDPLTGLHSRADMGDDLDREFARYRRGGHGFCVAICDIDHFKRINDTHHHDGGDQVLRAVAACIIRNVRSFDEAYRMGGEEFLICLINTALPDGVQVVERLRQSLEELIITLPDGAIVNVTASFGLVEVSDEQTIDEIIATADRALYRAKQGGRNRVVWDD